MHAPRTHGPSLRVGGIATPNGTCPCRGSLTPSPGAARAECTSSGPPAPRGRAGPRCSGRPACSTPSRGSPRAWAGAGQWRGMCAPWMCHVGLHEGRAFLEGLSALGGPGRLPSAHSAGRFRRCLHPTAVLAPGLLPRLERPHTCAPRSMFADRPPSARGDGAQLPAPDPQPVCRAEAAARGERPRAVFKGT